MVTTRVAVTAPAALRHTFYVDETGTDSTTTVTVTVTDPSGVVVSSGNATSTGAGSGGYQYVVPGQPKVTLLTASWAATIAGTAVTEVDYLEVAGGLLFSLAEGRASDTSLADVSRYPTAALATARLRVERECEHICDRAFVRRYGRVVLDGTGTDDVALRHPDVDRSVQDFRSLRRISLAPRADQTFVDLTASQLAAVVYTSDGMLRRLDNAVWTEGTDNVLVEFEYGLDAPPSDLVDAALLRLRSRLNLHRSSIPDRAESFTAVEGGTYRLSMPGAYTTGIPEVDAAYSRYSLRPTPGTGPGGAGGEGRPVSRTLNYDPSWSSMFHGGVR